MDLCLIHLSDFHLRTSTQLASGSILRSLVADASERVRDLDLPEPQIALSGDLAFGGRDEDYELVDSFLHTLGDGLHPRRIVFCPGNHDVNWSLLSPYSGELMDRMVTGGGDTVDATEARLANEADRRALVAGMGPYYSFLERHGVKPSNFLYYVESTKAASVNVNFISLNSAYIFSQKYFYNGYVGREQIRRAVAEAEGRGGQPTFNVTLVHHPLEAIVPPSQEETKKLLLQSSDVVLNGHVHSPRVSVEYTADLIGRAKVGPPPVISCARCVFNDEISPTETSGYSIFGVDFEYDRVASLKIWEVQLDPKTGRWYHDERKRTYPLVVKIPPNEGKEALGTPDQVGPKVTDAERRVLGRWRRSE